MKPSYEQLEQQLEKMAAENAGLKAMCEDRRTFIMNGVQLGYIQVPTVETDPALETIRVAVSPQESTPATDAFLAEVRASALPVEIAEIIDSGDLEAILFATEYSEAERYRIALYNFRTSRKGVRS